VKGKGKGSAAVLGATPAGELVAATPTHASPTAGGEAVMAGQASHDASTPAGEPGVSGSPQGKGAALGLGFAAGATNPGVGGVNGEANAAVAKKAAKKKPAPKKPAPKKKR